MKLFNIILQSETYNDYNRGDYYSGETHVFSGTELESVLDEAKKLVDYKCECRFLNGSYENAYDYMCAVNGVFVGGDANISYTNTTDEQDALIEELEKEAQSILNSLNVYEAERADFWKEQKNIKVRAENKLRLEQQRIRELAELKRLQDRYGKQ